MDLQWIIMQWTRLQWICNGSSCNGLDCNKSSLDPLQKKSRVFLGVGEQVAIISYSQIERKIRGYILNLSATGTVPADHRTETTQMKWMAQTNTN
ncbi:hypothetical protein CEXT_655181 [Caerostris extrusa]|uniref:Uncharacterized protein n=1 Tax=Caerostris extrusa TaxID=172846 RepID=A0AAV4QZ45_CAEEX|nr:hypothetical protein CEXT_655181 [Caerostris extrusa]